MNQQTKQAIQNLNQMLQRKYDEARANGASDEQALDALRSLWLEYLEGKANR